MKNTDEDYNIRLR